jgi:transposase
VKGVRSSSSHAHCTRWIGIDLNTTGHVAVAADVLSRKTMKRGRNSHNNHRQSSKKLHEIMEREQTLKTEKNQIP